MVISYPLKAHDTRNLKKMVTFV